MVAPSDHLISDLSALRAVVQTAAAAARVGALVAFGSTPTDPVTGYGYIQRGDPFANVDGCFRVDRFLEKPDRETAERFVKSGEYLWNRTQRAGV